MSPATHVLGGSEPRAGELDLPVSHERGGREIPELEHILEYEPAAVRKLVAVLSEPPVDVDGLDEETLSPLTLQTIVSNVAARQRAEREGFLAALTAYRELTERLSIDVADAREQLAIETERARLERQQLVKDFLERVDVLSAKISTSAARFTAELVEKEILRQQEEQRVLAYAQLAANAQSVIDDIQSSTSWRVTRPIRLLSRLLKQTRPPQSDH
jgi:hypothetical protein